MIITIEILKSNKKLLDLFTREEEYSPQTFDKHQRFPYSISKYKNILNPEVSEFLINNGFNFNLPKGKTFGLCLTHDVDNVYPSLKYRGFTSIKFLTKFRFKKAIKRFFKNENPYWNFREIIKLEEKYNAKSSFYFMVDESIYDAYELKNEMKYLVDNGYEVGLHGGYNAYNNLNEIENEKEKLEQILGEEVIGYRNHFLRFKVPDTWILLSKAGFKYDTTLGYAEHVGFRNGMCHPFRPYNLNDNNEINILEIPLMIMDGTLFQYMNLNVKESWMICKSLVDVIEKLNGILTIVWHNNSFDDIYYKNWGKLYESILNYCQEKNAWITSGEEIWKWWTQKILNIDN